MSRIKEILNQYQVNLTKPTAKYSNLQVFTAKHKETGLPYTVKIIANPGANL